jgi:NAD-dependent dihydropyrimidine dehydrogenase PreA subunit
MAPSRNGNGAASASGRLPVDAAARFQNPTNDTALALDGQGLERVGNGRPSEPAAAVSRIDEAPDRRWYPVIDYSRCTNCMECIDFCLFGVYGVDKIETILVEQPDNCRKGCPACSRVCPENAIIFPHHKTPAIAGSPEVGASLKIDLSELFGAPQENKSAAQIAAAERDEQLRLAGREPVGMSVGMPPPTAAEGPQEKDELDDLIEQLDSLDL